jgi:hypothetical protein
VDVRGAAQHGVGDDRVDELYDRRLIGRLAQLDHLGRGLLLGVLVDLLDRLLERREAGDQRLNVLG